MANIYNGNNVGVGEAPRDSGTYGRKDGTWVEVAGGVDSEVESYVNLAGFPVTGVEATVYIAEDTNLIYRWSGSAYVELSASSAIDHNSTLNKQGGTTDEYYHLTEQQKDLVVGINGSISTTLLSDITVTDNGDGTVTTGNCTAILKASTALDAEAQGVLLTGIGPIALSLNTKYFLVSDWNGGSPIQRIELASASTINNYTISLIGILTRGVGGDIYWTNVGQTQLDAVTKILRRSNSVNGLTIKTSGGLVSSPTGRYLYITPARYFVSNEIEETGTFDSTGTDRFSQLYGDSTAGFTETNNLATVNNTQYWNTATHALTALSPSRYAIRWIFQLIDSPNEVYSWVGAAQYTTLATARAASITTDLPIQLSQNLNISVLIAKVIVQEGQANVIEVDNVVNINTQTVSTSDHNQLSSLQGGGVDEYYHLTSAQHTIATQEATAALAGYVGTGTQTFAGTKTFTSTIAGSINGNSATASALQTARTIAGTSFDGSANIDIVHNNTTSTQGGTTGEKYHMTSAQHTIATQAASATVAGYVTTGTQTFAGDKSWTGTNDFTTFKIKNSSFLTTIAGSATADRTITLPNASGAMIISDSTGYANLKGTTNTAPNVSLVAFNQLDGTRTGFIGQGNGTTSILLFADNGNIILSPSTGNAVQAVAIYSKAVSAGVRAVNVDSSGYLGYVSSIRASKNNINYNLDTSFIYNLKPVSFEYRLKNENGGWLEETDGQERIGLIAEDVDLIKPEMTYKSNDGVLEGVDYQYLIPVLLNELQKLRKEVDILKGGV